MLDEIKEYKRQIEQYKAKESAGGADEMLRNAADVGGLKVVTARLAAAEPNALRQLGDLLRDKEPAVAAVLGTVNGEKVTLLAVCGRRPGRSVHRLP